MIDGSIDDALNDGFVREVTKGGTRRKYVVRSDKIYEILDGDEREIEGMVKNGIVYKYGLKGHLDKVGRVSEE